ncbi:MAG: PilZ domain-containing protein [Candidatus Omnitrophica bacterium]|nr:PilZ domain-containing protein [Candidatus Omnitrophota bacterium]
MMMKEKRGFIRLNIDAHAIYTIKGKDGVRDMVSLEDISSEGIRFISNMHLQNSDLLQLTLQIPGIDKDVTALGQVIWQRQLTMHLFDTGIRFTKIDKDNKKKLIDFIQYSRGRNIERREYIRSGLKTGIKYSLISDPGIQGDCFSVDVCALGLKIMLREKLEKGTQLRIVFNLPDGKGEVVAKCTVVAWGKQAEQELFETGVEFLEISEEDKGKIINYIQETLSREK